MYDFKEYPKWVYPEGKDPVIVQDSGEEAAVLGKTVAEVEAAVQADELAAEGEAEVQPEVAAEVQ